MSSKYSLTSRLLAGFALATLSLATVAEAQPYGPDPGSRGMMDGGWGWGMGGGMGGFGGVGLVALVVLGIAVLVFRRRNT
jgi:hypothetical protein